MNRMNEKGMQLLEYKKELLKDYPELVKKSLLNSLDQLGETDVVDTNTLFILKDEEQTFDSFKEYLEENLSFMKTEAEIFKEFELLRKNLDELFESNGLSELDTESFVSKDCILASRRFALDNNFTREYFGVEEGDANKLMKRRGFVEKFAVLRLMAIFKPFIQRLENSDTEVKTDISFVYYDKELDAYAIDLFFELPIETIEDLDESTRLSFSIRSIIEEAVELYDEKMQA